jgi:small-conductance mechanosensitive channel
MKQPIFSARQALCIAALAMSVQACVWAQSPMPAASLLGPASGQPTAPRDNAAQPSERTLADIDAQTQEMQKRLAAIQTDIIKAQAAINDSTTVETAARTAAQDRLNYLRGMQEAYSQIIDNLKNLRRVTTNLETARKEKENWQAPAGTAPWPLSVADDLQLKMLRLQFQLQHLKQRTNIVNDLLADHRKIRTQAEVELRQSSTGPEATRASEAIQRRLDRINLDLANTAIDKDTINIEQATGAISLATLKLTKDFYNARFTFTEKDFEKIKIDLQKRIDGLKTQEQQASLRINRTLDLAAAAKAKSDALEQNATATTEARTAARNARLLADRRAEAARTERERYRAQIELDLLMIQIWEIRRDLYANVDNNQQLAVLKSKYEDLVRQLNLGLSYLNQLIAEKSQSTLALNEQLRQASTSAEKAFLTEMLAPLAEQIDIMRGLYALFERARQYLEITGSEIAHAQLNQTFVQRFSGVKASVLELANDIWQFEIFAVDDNIVVDGREIKTKRSVTVGKTIGAMAILIIGFMLISGLIRRTLALAVNKANLGASKSVVLGRWLTLAAGFSLILTAFNIVEIPLSAFAFFGGALAIGVGFGTQNLLKNLISGVMLLIEKPIRIGDLVEIDGILGTVTSIGIRFSTIQGAQGNDALIPNSVLVEQKLVNWTYSTRDARRDVRVTVSYKSSVQEVQRILAMVSSEHPQVKQMPEPVITLEDFGDNGLVFNLQFWIRLQAGMQPAQILSDLRVSILAAFAKAGIELPYPQRAVMFDQSNPIAVRVHPSSTSAL